jgi:hypothetical protein
VTKSSVAEALEEIKSAFPDAEVSSLEDSDGGAYVVVDPVSIGSAFSPTSTWVGFHMTFAYPEADVYPHFIGADVKYVGDGPTPNRHVDGDLPTPLSRDAKMLGFDKPAIQISRRTKTVDSETRTALHKLQRVLEFLRTR